MSIFEGPGRMHRVKGVKRKKERKRKKKGRKEGRKEEGEKINFFSSQKCRGLNRGT